MRQWACPHYARQPLQLVIDQHEDAMPLAAFGRLLFISECVANL